MAKKHFVLYLVILYFLTSCNTDTSKSKNLPKASGKTGEIILVIDSATWQSAVGDEIRDIFSEPVATLPRPESMFDLNRIDPFNFVNLFQRQKNILIVSVINDKGRGNRKLRNLFTQESLEKIEKDSSIYMYAKKDEYALDQAVLYLFGNTEMTLIENLRKNKSKIQNIFLQVEADRISKSIVNASSEKKLSNHIKEKFGCEILVPFGFDIAVESDNFLWLRSFTTDVDKNVFLSWVDYTSEDLFSLDSLLKLRTEISKPYILYKPEDKESYLLAETKYSSVSREELNFKDLYAVKLQGLWKINNYTMGGPFISYAMVDESTRRLYYLEAFLYSPGQPQRDYMRELQAILNTFKVGKTPA
jgi:hypothetical protein